MDTSYVAENTYRVSINAKDLLFESMWPVPTGVSMNSYIIQGEKTAIIDGVCGWDGVPETFFRLLDDIKIDLDSIDYVVVNHTEPDHSEWLTSFRKLKPNFTIYASSKAKNLLQSFFHIENEIIEVKSGDTLDLGGGHVLQFEDIPNVHWPDTIATFDTKTGTLFPCDLYGSFGSISDAPYDDQMTQEEIDSFEPESLRYYANIIGAFSTSVQRAIKKLDPLPINIIAPGHGIVWRKNPQEIVDQYSRYARYSKGPAEEAVTVIWSSMYGNTEQGVAAVLKGIEEAGFQSYVHNVPESHVSYILRDVLKSSAVVIASPTYEYDLFPAMAAVVDEIAKKKIHNRPSFHFGSYGWKTASQKGLDELNERLKMNWQFIEPVNFICAPLPEDLQKIEQRGKELVQMAKEWIATSE